MAIDRGPVSSDEQCPERGPFLTHTTSSGGNNCLHCGATVTLRRREGTSLIARALEPQPKREPSGELTIRQLIRAKFWRWLSFQRGEIAQRDIPSDPDYPFPVFPKTGCPRCLRTADQLFSMGHAPGCPIGGKPWSG